MIFAFLSLLALAPPAAGAHAIAPNAATAESDAGPPPIAPRDDSDRNGDDASDANAPHGDAGPATAPAIPNLALSAHVEPDVVPFGAAFSLVIVINRDRGVRLDIPGALPDIDNTPRTGDPVRTVEELPAPARASDAPDAGPSTSVSAPAVRVRETIKIPFLALDTTGVKTPAFVLTGKDGATVDVPALEVRVQVDADAMPNPMGPDAGPPPPGTVVLESAAPAMAYAVPDARPFVVAGAFATSGILFALVRFVARRRKLHAPPAPLTPPPPPRPAHEVAIERLDGLLASGLLQRGESGVFVERLMDEVLRDYIEARFALHAGARTTRELVKELLGVAALGLDIALVEGLLADADLVKFAKASIAADRAHAMATRVRALVDATKLVANPGPRGGA